MIKRERLGNVGLRERNTDVAESTRGWLKDEEARRDEILISLSTSVVIPSLPTLV